MRAIARFSCCLIALTALTSCAQTTDLFGASSTATATPVKGTGTQTQTAFELHKKQITIDVFIGNKGPYQCVLDSGTNPSAIDLSLAQKLGLPLSDESGQAAGVGSEQVKVYKSSMSVSVGAAVGPMLGATEPREIAVAAVDLAPLADTFGKPLHCILGQSWLRHYATKIDYPKQQLTIVEGGVAGQRGQCRTDAMKFWLKDDLMPLVQVKVKDKSLDVSLDTGSSGSLKLYPEAEKLLGENLRLLPLPANEMTGIRGQASVRPGVLSELRFGPLQQTQVSVTLGERNEGETPVRMGNLGNGILAQMVLTLDYPNRQITLCQP